MRSYCYGDGGFLGRSPSKYITPSIESTWALGRDESQRKTKLEADILGLISFRPPSAV